MRSQFFILICLSIIVCGCVSNFPIQAPTTTLPIEHVISMFPTESPDCLAPCWNYLIPGKSTQADVAHFLQQLKPMGWSIDPPITNNENDGFFLYNITDTKGKLVRLQSKNNLLSDIELYDLENVKLSQLVEKYGPPEFMEYNISEGDIDVYNITVHYPKLGLSFEVEPDEDKPGVIQPEYEVGSAFYYSPGEMSDYYYGRYSCCVKDAADLRELTQDQMNKIIQKWQGYGRVGVTHVR